MKRNRLDGQLNKEEYESASEVTADSPVSEAFLELCYRQIKI
jgi:hypothetical protein